MVILNSSPPSLSAPRSVKSRLKVGGSLNRAEVVVFENRRLKKKASLPRKAVKSASFILHWVITFLYFSLCPLFLLFTCEVLLVSFLLFFFEMVLNLF